MDSQETAPRPARPASAACPSDVSRRFRWALIWLLAVTCAACSLLLYSVLLAMDWQPAGIDLSGRHNWVPVAGLAAGLLLGGLLTAYLALLLRRAARLQGLAPPQAAKTAPSASHDHGLPNGESRFRSLVETTSDWIWETDANCVYTYVSPKVRDLLGYEPEEVLGKTPFDLMPLDEAERVGEVFRKISDSREPVVRLENVNRHKDGRLVVLETSAVPLLSADGSLRGYRGVDRDITQRKQAEDAVRRERRRLRQLLDLQERERKLVAYEIHDGIAQQLAGALLKLEAFGQAQDHGLQQAQATYSELKSLLSDSIDEARRLISGLRPPILDELGVVAAIDSLIREGQRREGREIEFRHNVSFTRLAPPLETAIFRIVQESLTNAWRHSQSKKVRVELLELGGHVRIEVQDWGIGFDPDTVAEHRFGLQGIRQRAHLLDGQASVDSAPGKGTRIVVELPLLEAVPDAATPQVLHATARRL